MAAHTQWPEINVPLGRRRGTAGAFWKWRVSGQKHGEINRLESGMLAPGEEISLGLVFCLRILLLKMSHGDFLSRTMTWPDVATEEKNLIFFSLCSAIESIPGLIEWLLGCTAEEEVICYAFFMWNSFCKQNSSRRAPITEKCELN